MGQGSENLVELLVAPGLAAAGTLAAPEEAHLELSAEHLQELWPGLKPCGAGQRGPSCSWGGWGSRLGSPHPSLQFCRDSTWIVDGHGHAI